MKERPIPARGFDTKHKERGSGNEIREKKRTKKIIITITIKANKKSRGIDVTTPKWILRSLRIEDHKDLKKKKKKKKKKGK